MKKRLDRLALIFGAGRDVAEDLDRIDALPLDQRADACRDLLASKKYVPDSKVAYAVLDKFFDYLEFSEIKK